jgi:hypothetical protein
MAKILTPGEAGFRKGPKMTMREVEGILNQMANAVNQLMAITSGMDTLLGMICGYLKLDLKDLRENYEVLAHPDGKMELIKKEKKEPEQQDLPLKEKEDEAKSDTE